MQLAKDCEQEIREGLTRLAARKRKKTEQRQMLAEVADLFQAGMDPF